MRSCYRFVIACAFTLLCASSLAAQPSLLSDLTAVRAMYDTPMTPAQVGQMLNMVAWQHRAAGWGLLAKDYGTFCTSPVGPIACDILVYQPSGQHFDVLIDAEHDAEPTWQVKGPIDMARFRAPVNPGTSVTPATPTTTTSSDPDLDAVIARMDDIEQRIRELMATLDRDQLRLATHETAIAAIPALTDQMQTLVGQVSVLVGRAVPVTCIAALNLGATRVPISCRLQ